MTLAGDITSSQVHTSVGIMVASILKQIFTLISTYVNTWKARWHLQITTIHLTSVLSALPSASLALYRKSSYAHIIQVSSWRSRRGHIKAKFLYSKSVVSQTSALRLKAQVLSRRKSLQPPNISMPFIGIKCPISFPRGWKAEFSATFPTGY